VQTMLDGRRDLRHRVEQCEKDIADLKRHVPGFTPESSR
jgi:hypothetical protein